MPSSATNSLVPAWSLRAKGAFASVPGRGSRHDALRGFLLAGAYTCDLYLCYIPWHRYVWNTCNVLLNLCWYQTQRVQPVEFLFVLAVCIRSMLVCLTIKYYYPSIYVNIPWSATYVLWTLKLLIISVRGHLFRVIFLWSDAAGTVINWWKLCGAASTTWWLGGTDWLSGLETVTSSSRHEHV